jgi:hypothetical protein
MVFWIWVCFFVVDLVVLFAVWGSSQTYDRLSPRSSPVPVSIKQNHSSRLGFKLREFDSALTKNPCHRKFASQTMKVNAPIHCCKYGEGFKAFLTTFFAYFSRGSVEQNNI